MIRGFFTRQQLTEGDLPTKSRRAAMQQDLSAERLNAIGLDGVREMNPTVKTFDMKPSGPKRPLVYILGEAPAQTDDEQGTPFVGPAGQTLRQMIGFKNMKVTRLDNVVRVRPPKSRKTTFVEIECFRRYVVRSIERARPKAILAVGVTSARWFLGDLVPSIGPIRGRRFPVRVGKHRCWMFTAFHPSYVTQTKDWRDGEDIERVTRRDIARCYTEARNPSKLPPEIDLKRELKSVRLVLDRDSAWECCKFIRHQWRKQIPVAFDVETNRKRPYYPGAKLLSIAISGRDETWAIPLEHPDNPLDSDIKAAINVVLKGLWDSNCPKVAHNLPFDLEWIAYCGSGFRLLMWSREWYCTQAAAFVLDERYKRPVQQLEFVTAQMTGARLKEFSKSESGVGEKLDSSRLEDADLTAVLKYNGLDSLITRKNFFLLRREIRREGLEKVYEEQCRRVPPLVAAQMKGFPVSQDRVELLGRKFQADRRPIMRTIRRDPSVKKYQNRFGKFKPSNSHHVRRLMQNVLKRPEGETEKGGYSTKESVLSAMTDLPLAASLLKMRGLDKLISTYIKAVDAREKKTKVFPDGRVHCHFNSTFTETRRTSSDDPSMQNWPIRETPIIRSMFEAPPGWRFLKIDMSAQEYRCIGMHSRDKTIIHSLLNNVDIHMQWVEKIVRVWPNTCRKRHGSLKDKALMKFRDEVKNQMVFPAFYKAGVFKIAKGLEMPERILKGLFVEFWRMFRGVKLWQDKVIGIYSACGYAESLSGFRRHGPMNVNQLINFGPQCDGSDIVVDAAERLLTLARDEDDINYIPHLLIHDDLTFMIPRKKVDDYVPIIASKMVNCPLSFINVPLACKAYVGRNWYKMDKVGEFSSDSKMPSYNSRIAE